MKTLFGNLISWPWLVGISIVLRLLFIEMSWTSYFSIIISIHQIMLLFSSIGHVLPVRYLLGAFMCVQFFIGPTLAYNGLDQYQYAYYKMRVPEEVYFGYAIPAVLAFILGIHTMAGKLKGEVVDIARISVFVQRNPTLPYIFIGVGFVSSIVSTFFSSDLGFVFYLLGSFKFIGLFLLVLGTRKLKVFSLMVVMGSIVSSSLGEGMFHDLLTWILFTASIFALKFKFSFNVKLMGASAFMLLAITIQVLKSSYRTATGSKQEDAGIETFSKIYAKQSENSSIFSFERLAPSNVRINQGFIITNIMSTVPDKVPFSNGEEMYQIFEAALLPRIIAPNKLTAGNREIFTKYSGIRLTAGTSMGLSSLGDAYINYGKVGGCIFMFLLGWMYSYILVIFGRKSKTYPALILFTAMVFYFPIRPDCELQTILGHLFKSCFLIYVLIVLFKSVFKQDKISTAADSNGLPPQDKQFYSVHVPQYV